MFDWLKPKKSPPLAATGTPDRAADSGPQTPNAPQTREQIVAEAMKNAQAAREAIGSDKLEQLAKLLLSKKQQEETSPAAQAKKIIAQMDKDRLGDFLKFMVREDQTKH